MAQKTDKATVLRDHLRGSVIDSSDIDPNRIQVPDTSTIDGYPRISVSPIPGLNPIFLFDGDDYDRAGVQMILEVKSSRYKFGWDLISDAQDEIHRAEVQDVTFVKRASDINYLGQGSEDEHQFSAEFIAHITE